MDTNSNAATVLALAPTRDRIEALHTLVTAMHNTPDSVVDVVIDVLTPSIEKLADILGIEIRESIADLALG